MLITLKIIHFFSLYAGGGAGLGSAILMARSAAAGPPTPVVAGTVQVLGRLGLVAIVLLWLTGLPLAVAGHGSLALGWAFYLKLAGASLVLGAVAAMTAERGRAARENRPPVAAKMKRLGQLALIGMAVAVIFAAVTFA